MNFHTGVTSTGVTVCGTRRKLGKVPVIVCMTEAGPFYYIIEEKK